MRSPDLITPHEGLEEVRQVRQALGIDEDQNIAYAELTINDDDEELIAVSGYQSPAGTVPLPPYRVFDTFDVEFDRSADSEVKLLEEIGRRLRQERPARATVRLFSERPPCDSCEGVIVQFRAEFPEPDVRLVVSNAGE